MYKFKFRFLYSWKNFQFIVAAFVISLTTLITISLLIRQQVHTFVNYSDAIEHSFEVMNKLEVLEQLLKDSETGMRGYMLTKDSTFLQPYLNVNGRIKPAFEDVRKIILKGSRQSYYNSKQLDELRYINEKIILENSVFNDLLIVHHSKEDEIALLRKGKSIMDSMRADFENMRTFELKVLNQMRNEKDEYKKLTPAYLSYLLIFSVILTLASFVYILKELFTRYNYQHTLEQKIKELNQSNDELEQIAYASSHHLQEPLRKLRLFSSRLLYKYKNVVEPDVKISAERIDASALAMQELIKNLADYTSLSKTSENTKSISLDVVLNEVLHSLQNELMAKDAEIKADSLPEVKGSFRELMWLFKNLLENSVKFAQKNVSLIINISYSTGYYENEMNKQEYHIITIEDNGIGFDNKYVEKIFVLFKKLHSPKSFEEGKGIGLAICKRIMTNHKGHIKATGIINEGARFELYFPV